MEDGCPRRYVVSFEGNPAMALGLLFDHHWFSDIMRTLEADPRVQPVVAPNRLSSLLFKAVQEYGKELEAHFPEEVILIGEDTDPDGPELLVVVPFEKRESIDKVAKEMANAYFNVKKKFEDLWEKEGIAEPCSDCASVDCAFIHQGQCRYALVHDVMPTITEHDGCLNFLVGN